MPNPHGDFDERLADALDSALSDGEEIVAREAGDQGQAIALTSDHIILVRVGIAATGEMEGHRTSKFPLADVTAINLRKGALGAVIQVVSNEAHSEAPSGAPDNVIVFTGPGRVKKAEGFADTIESVTGKAVARVEPHSQAAPEASAEPVVREVVAGEPVAAAVESEPEVEEPVELTAREGYSPNPRLPKPVRKQKHGPNKMLVVMGVLAGLTVVGMAVMAPIHDARLEPAPIVGTSFTSVSQRSIRLQLSAVTNYDDQVSAAMAKADAEASAVRSAVRSASQPAVQKACRPGRIDNAWQKISALAPPSGLAEANQNLLDGLLIMKTAAAAASASATVDSKEALARFDEAESLIRKGRSVIATQQANLEKQAAQVGRPVKH
jgi:hypothetical protein